MTSRGRASKRRPEDAGRASTAGRGATIEVSSTEAQNTFGRVLEAAARGARVFITRHNRPAAVVMSVADYDELVDAREAALDALTDEYDQLLARMQEPGFEEAMERGFSATPAEFGEIAVRAATRHG